MPIMHGARALAKTLVNSSDQPESVSYPVMPVIVKTTLYPIVVAGVTEGEDLAWQSESFEDGIKMVAVNNADKPIGFCLTGVTANKEKQSLLKELV